MTEVNINSVEDVAFARTVAQASEFTFHAVCGFCTAEDITFAGETSDAFFVDAGSDGPGTTVVCQTCVNSFTFCALCEKSGPEMAVDVTWADSENHLVACCPAHAAELTRNLARLVDAGVLESVATIGGDAPAPVPATLAHARQTGLRLRLA